MADLVIKPTSGNLIIKDDQSVARLTIAPTSGATTLSNVTAGTLGSGVHFPAGHVLKVSSIAPDSDTTTTNNVSAVNWWPASKTYTPDGGSGNNTTIHSTLTLFGMIKQQTESNARVGMRIVISGANITNLDYTMDAEVAGHWDYGGSGAYINVFYNVTLPSVTLDGNGNGALTYGIYWSGRAPAHSDQTWAIYADGTKKETHLTITEVQ